MGCSHVLRHTRIPPSWDDNIERDKGKGSGVWGDRIPSPIPLDKITSMRFIYVHAFTPTEQNHVLHAQRPICSVNALPLPCLELSDFLMQWCALTVAVVCGRPPHQIDSTNNCVHFSRLCSEWPFLQGDSIYVFAGYIARPKLKYGKLVGFEARNRSPSCKRGTAIYPAIKTPQLKVSFSLRRAKKTFPF